MPSARDLLQQADTLMRINRTVGASDLEEEVPLLTDVAVPGSSGVSHRQQRDDIPTLIDTVTTTPPAVPGASSWGDSRSRFPVTAALGTSTIFPLSQMPPSMVGNPVADEQKTEPVFSVTSMRMQLADAEDWDAALAAPVPSPAPPAPPETPPVPEAAAVSAAEIAETVYYQVLQNLDLYTERALQEHLTTHLSPILERASSELLATLHANLGAVIRHFVAEAIEKQVGVRPDSHK